jgi:hypothetical protein
MADITMCNGAKCPFKNKCYRYTAPISYRQSMFVETPFKDGLCDYYWETPTNKL